MIAPIRPLRTTSIKGCGRSPQRRDRARLRRHGDLCQALQQRLGVPPINGVGAAVKPAEGLVGLGLGTSKRGDYAAALIKTYTGLAAPYSPR